MFDADVDADADLKPEDNKVIEEEVAQEEI